MFAFLLIVQAVIAVSLIGVILMQRSEGGGLGVGGSSSGFMTARGAADFLTRATSILGGQSGFIGIPHPQIFGHRLDADTFFLVAVVVTSLWFLLYRNAVRSPFGNSLLVLQHGGVGLSDAINTQDIAEPIVATLVGAIGLIAAVAIGAFTLQLLQRSGGSVSLYPPTLIAALIAGACLGFLPHNFQPARIFMGDSGAMLIGLMLAAASTSASGKLLPVSGATDALALFSPLLVVAAVLFVPLLDLLLAVVRRTRAGRSPFAADKLHLHHRLLEIGHSHRRAVLLIYLWAALIAFGAVAFTLFDVRVVVWSITLGLLIAMLGSMVPRLRAR